MKNIFRLIPVLALALIFGACNDNVESATESKDAAAQSGGQEAVQDDVSQKDVVKVAVGSKDHTTLVAALKQAGLVTSLANAGPFTVFAPTNDAFNKLPAGTVEGLMKDEKKADLQDVLQYHVTTSALSTDMLQNLQTLGMVNGGSVSVSVKDGKVSLNGGAANIVASVRASNGWVHVIDAVLLPPAK
ncbi:MAG TPA: fasciclin domain-containing protein [Chitinophagaceae bacterium]|nr:fasciclin domain-containing protein [Chitinophagaceae bacterium]